MFSSIYIVDKPIIKVYDSLVSNREPQIKISGQLAKKLIIEAFKKNVKYSSCSVEIGMKDFTIAVEQSYCCPTFKEYIFPDGYKYRLFSGSFINTITIYGKTFPYRLRGKKIIIGHKQKKEEKNIKLYFCARINENLLKYLFFDNYPQQLRNKVSQYLETFKKLCLLVLKNEVTLILICEDNRKIKNIFLSIINIYKSQKDIKLVKIRNNLYFLNLIDQINKLVFFEYIPGSIIIRFATGFNNDTLIKRFARAQYQNDADYIVYLNNIKLAELIEYISLLFPNIDIKKNQYKITGRIEW